MSQSVVTIRLNGNPYQIGCGVGEEAHVNRLGEEIEAIMQSLVASVGQIGEARLLAMVALILADRAESVADEREPNADHDAAAEALEIAAERVAALVSRITKP